MTGAPLQSRLVCFTIRSVLMSTTAGASTLYRQDGVRITHDPFAPGMGEKYGAPGATDSEGFDPYQDSVGPGIYGGVVKRGADGRVIIGRQYQDHNKQPGPVYAGGGYTPMSKALGDDTRVEALLRKYPDLVNDVATGGAQPLHMCGMSRSNQLSTALLITHGESISARPHCSPHAIRLNPEPHNTTPHLTLPCPTLPYPALTSTLPDPAMPYHTPPHPTPPHRTPSYPT